MAKLTSSPHQLSEILPWLVSLSVLTIRPHVRDSRLTTCGPDQREKKPKIFRPIFFALLSLTKKRETWQPKEETVIIK